MASSGALQEVLALPASVKPEDPKTLAKIETIDFSKVTFSYATREAAAVLDVSFSAKQGETIAFAGLSGSGKSTLIKLIAGLYSPTSGTIWFNGTDSATIDFDALRRKIGLVAQETQLFAGTIRDNLLFVNPDASEKACLESLRAASAIQLVERGEKGLDTKIGEGGIKLSGGERQRLAIARALLRRPEILVFDEATSSLDSLTERDITATIKEIGKESPLIKILVAHRLSTIAHADRIYVLQAGAIVESGRHEDLLVGNGLYSALWREQIARAENVSSL
jgi:ATP-binding cassette subfamily B protein